VNTQLLKLLKYSKIIYKIVEGFIFKAISIKICSPEILLLLLLLLDYNIFFARSSTRYRRPCPITGSVVVESSLVGAGAALASRSSRLPCRTAVKQRQFRVLNHYLPQYTAFIVAATELENFN